MFWLFEREGKIKNEIIALLIAGIIGFTGCGVGTSPDPEPSNNSNSSYEYKYNWDVNPESEFNGYIPSEELKLIVEDTIEYYWNFVDKSNAKFALIDLDESDMGSNVAGNYYGEGPEIALYFPDLESIFIMTLDDSFITMIEEEKYIPNTFWPIENAIDPSIIVDYEGTIGLKISPEDYYHVIGVYWKYSDNMQIYGTDDYKELNWNDLYV